MRASEASGMAMADAFPAPRDPAIGWQGQVLVLLAAVIVGLAGQYLSVMLWIRPNQLPFAWIPGGILLAVLALRPRREWPAWLLGVLAGGVAALAWRQVPVLLAVCAYLVNFAGIVLAAIDLQRNGNRLFESVSDFVRHFILAIVLVPAATGLGSATLVHLAGLRPELELSLLWLTLAMNYAMGYLLVSTGLIALAGSHVAAMPGRWARAAEALLLTLALLLLSAGLWLLVPSSSAVLPLQLFAPAPLLMLAAMRFGSTGAAAALLLVAVPAAWLGVYMHGSAPPGGEHVNAQVVQLSLLAVGFLVHVLAIVSRQYESARLLLSASHRHARSLTWRLMQAQEEERSRIARELHDGVNQQVASLAIVVSALKRVSPDPVASGLDELHLSMLRLSDDVRRISHNLHPGLLEHVGLGAALEAMVRAQTETWDGQIHFEWEPADDRPDTDTTLCLYRVAQEALHNAVRHSGARLIRLQFEADSRGSYLLVVEDDGKGFDLEQIHRAGGLGLLSMQERVALRGGSMAVVSSRGAGTQIRVHVPAEQR